MMHLLSRLIAGLLLCSCAAGWAASDAPFLWEIQGAKAKHYLMGSVHLLPASTQPLPAALENAYAKASGVVFETDIGDPNLQTSLFNAAVAPNGLRPLISKSLYERLQRRANELNMPLEQACDLYKPWFCAITLEIVGLQRAGFKAEYGLDQYFYTRALKDDKSITWIETPKTQVDLFNKISDKLSEQLLVETLDEQEDPSQSPEGILRTWRNGDLVELERITREMKAHQPQAYAHLLADRNRVWIPKLEKLLASDSSQLIIVGSAHTVGPDGLLALLKAKGYESRALSTTDSGKADTARAATSPRANGAPWLVPTLTVHDMDAASAFYPKAFGFDLGNQQRDEKGKLTRGELKYHDAAIILNTEDAKHVSPATAKSAAPPPLILYVDNVDATVTRAKKAGADIVEAPTDQSWGERSALLRDPDGYLWQLAAPLAVKPAAVKANP